MSPPAPPSTALATGTGPSPPELPPPPASDFFSETQWTVLMALLDAVVPSITTASIAQDEKTKTRIREERFDDVVKYARKTMADPPSADNLRAFLEDRPCSDPAFIYKVRRTLGTASESSRKQLGAALTALSTRAGSLLLTGHATPVQDQPLHVRETILQNWAATRWFGTPRLLFKAFAMLGTSAWLQTSPLFRQVGGFDEVPPNWKAGPAEDFEFLQFPSGQSEAVLETDVVIVGSGCGGGVCAKVLAEAGHRVVVVDKGHYFPPSQLPMPQDQGAHYMFENNGVIASSDSAVNVIAGSCWGGGGSVNWSVCLQTQGFVRREWAEEHGLPFFETNEFQECLDRVCGFMGAGESDNSIQHSHRSQVLLDGSRKLGWHAKVCPQNTRGKEHPCGHCHLGCGSAEKQGPAVSWLPAAAKTGRAKFVEGFSVDKVTWRENSGKKRAAGIVGTWTSRDANGGVSGPDEERTTRRVRIKAKKVIVSAGSLNSPLVLLRSGLTNRHIGRNLHLHPVNFVGAYYEEDTKPMEGGIITSVCTTLEDLDGKGHGVKLEAMCMVPYLFVSQLPWRGGLDFKLQSLRYRHLDGFIALTRDRDTGRVYPDPVTGRPCIDYYTSQFDAAHALEGVIAIAKICYVTGATEIHACLPGVEPFVRESSSSDKKEDLGVRDPAFMEWLDKVRAAGNKAPYAPFSSAHQMGSCRMSSHPGGGVVDPKGKVWGVEDLYVADASVMPSASGVNPMVTNMAISDWIARGIAAELKA
ncbi:hypothetical protein QBC46DRAFT_449951 [Diplogelasinospora grovesii]|uniref:Long-chain-alcohol oxidase n=1 Tax=Diplogelasinospora grovesii TaxID=303347 RepID=A0AAN6N7L3_9PEZI|nr:hypothetical protein QBC46DRAFT_449951 [Diplogelasinospora grovesii]